MATKRNVYLKMMSLSQARQVLFERFGHLRVTKTDTLPTPDAVGRTLAEAVFARISAPNFHASAMDGIAVRAENTFGASESRPMDLAIGPDAVYVNTGHVLPNGCNAVIMIEHVQPLDDHRVRIEAPAFPWQHVRKMGEDIVATELLFPAHHVITPYCIGALLTGGIFEVAVLRAPRVLIIPTGSELVDWHTTEPRELTPGQVLETNSYALGKLVEACGGAWTRHDTIVDDPALIADAVGRAGSDGYDLVLTVGGSSAGSEDYARAVIDTLGEVVFHGVTIMPGKPVIMGDVNGTPVFGMPGYPVSAIIAFEQFVRPLIAGMLGVAEPRRETASVWPTRNIPSKLGVEEFVRVKLGRVGERIVATPLPRGAGSITTFTEADGIIRIGESLEGITDKSPVTAELMRPRSAVDNTLVIVGSHDNTLDVMTDHIRRRFSHLTVSSSHVGSLGGLMAVKKGVCHLAGSHLLDVEDGTYNISYVNKHLAGIHGRLVTLVHRDQGLMVRPGNPKSISGIEDLAREDVTMVNRQAGSGTRILLDYRLGELGIDPAGIRGYEQDEFTHMNVAVAVLSGTADVGLGIYAAARALGLEFIPVVTEQYDLVMTETVYRSDLIRCLMEVIHSEAFKKQVIGMGGYSTEHTGSVREFGRPA